MTWLILRVLPLLAPGVLVHIHDVFWPHGYPAAWLRQHRDWNESYFLLAFLSGNPSCGNPALELVAAAGSAGCDPEAIGVGKSRGPSAARR